MNDNTYPMLELSCNYEKVQGHSVTRLISGFGFVRLPSARTVPLTTFSPKQPQKSFDLDVTEVTFVADACIQSCYLINSRCYTYFDTDTRRRPTISAPHAA